MILERTSPITRNKNTMEFAETYADAISTWFNTPSHERPLIQDAFPDMTANQREFILSGITPDEWDDTFMVDDD